MVTSECTALAVKTTIIGHMAVQKELLLILES